MKRTLSLLLVLVMALLAPLTSLAAKGAPDAPADFRFTVGGTDYEICELQDVPVSQRENLLDGREGHCIQFSYITSDASEASNSTLYDEAKVITPAGEEIRTYSNAGNVANPYSLYFGLPDDVLLGDCMLRVPDDAGERLISLGATEAPTVTSEPLSITGPSDAPNTLSGSTLSNKDGVKPKATEAPPEDLPTEKPMEKPTEAPAATPTVAPSTETPVAEEPTPAPQAVTGFEDIVTAALETLSEEAKDPWQKAIYDAGARDFALETEDEKETLTLVLRSFDPDLKALGAYPGEDPAAWRAQMFENISAYSLPVSIPLKEGTLDQEAAQKALQRAVRTAAENAKTAFNKNAVRQCLADAILPAPMDKLSSAEDLDSAIYLPAFTEYAASDLAPDLDAAAYAPLFYGQVSQKLSVKDGPHALVLNCKGAAPATLLEKASAATLETLSQQYRANDMSDDEITAAFYEGLVQSANALKKKGAADFSLLMDIDSVIDGDYGVDYRNFLAAYAFGDAQDELRTAVWAMPDAPAQDYPKSGYLSGGKSGTKVIIKAPGDGMARYVQMRRSDTDEVKVTLFLRPGGSGTVYVPSGFYYMLIAAGESWYGEEGLFGDEGRYSKTSETEILGKKYYHTIELQTTSEGNITTWGADMDDFF